MDDDDSSAGPTLAPDYMSYTTTHFLFMRFIGQKNSKAAHEPDPTVFLARQTLRFSQHINRIAYNRGQRIQISQIKKKHTENT